MAKTTQKNEKMRNRAKLVVAVIIIVAAIMVLENPFRSGGVIEDSENTGINIGQRAPDFVLEDLNGETVRLSDFRGENVLVNFWATWCPFCVDEMPLFQEKFAQGDIVVIGVNLQESDIDGMRRFVDDLGVTYPLVLDPNSDVKRTYDVFTQPVSYFIDKNGIITDRKFGPLTEEEFEDKIALLLQRDTTDNEIQTGEIRTLETSTRIGGSLLSAGTKYLDGVDLSRIQSGGPGKGGIGTSGGIPALLDPDFVNADEANLNDDNLVLGMEYNGVVKAYPIRILNWHEIVNDFAGDKPVAVTFCPLCRSGVAFDPLIDGERQLFGVSGKLFNSDLVMYDQKTDTYWSQIKGQAIIGELTGMKLRQIPTEITRWKSWRELHPDTLVLSQNTGFSRPYGADDIYGTLNPGFSGFGVGFNDDRLASNAIVFGIEIDGQQKAYHDRAVERDRVINDDVNGKPLVVVWDEELETVKIFDRTLDGETLTFTYDNGIKDNKGNTWTISDLENLERVPAFGHFWFAWLAFFPETGLFN